MLQYRVMTNRERGGPFPDVIEHLEAKLIGPYPTWNSWKHQLEKRFEISLKNGYSGTEPMLRRFYILRRLQQKKDTIDQEKIEEFWKGANEKIPEFEKKFSELVTFIVEKTPIASPKKIRRR